MSVKPDVLRVARRGKVLGTRALGRELATEIRQRIAGAPAAVIDFDGVEVASSPLLDEIACAMRSAIKDLPGRFVVLANLNEDVRDTLELVLQRRTMQLTTIDAETLTLLGGRQHLEETLAEAQALGTFTAAQLAERLKVKLPNLHQRLAQLEAAGAVARTEALPDAGRAHQFSTAKASELVSC